MGAEFPGLGVARTSGGTRTYRRADVERVLLIKQLVFVEGLTLAGARRRIESDQPPGAEHARPPVVDGETRQKLDAVKRDLRALLQMLDGGRAGAKPASWPPRSQPTLSRVRGPRGRGECRRRKRQQVCGEEAVAAQQVAGSVTFSGCSAAW